MSTAEELLPQFKTRFPEFASENDDRLTLYIGDALGIFCLRDTCTLYLAAHLLALDNESGASATSGATVDGGLGEITSESVESKSVAFKTQSDRCEDVFYATTPYGRRYLACRNTTPGYRFRVRVY